MIRTLVFAAASLLMVGVLYGEGKKPEAKVDGVKEKSPEAKSETVTKEGTEAKTEPASPQAARRRGSRGEGSGHRGKVTKASFESGVLKLNLDGKDYEFAVGDHTHAMLRTTEKDGKETIVGVQLSNGQGRKAASRTRRTKKGKVE